MTLVEFLTARLDEDEQIARRDRADLARVIDRAICDNTDTFLRQDSLDAIADEVLARPARGAAPARVLREVEAKREIIRGYSEDGYRNAWDGCGDDCEWKALGWALRLLASVYSDHPDYQPDWA